MNKPFFQTDLFGNEIKSKEKTKKEYTQEELCEKCQKYKTCLSPKIKPKGKGKKQILIITEFITKEEDEQGFLNNKAGKYLQETLKELDINLFEDCYIIPAIRCKSKGIPTNSDIKLCKGNLLREIEILLPKKIITFGKIALESLIGHKESVTTYEQWIGFNIPDQEYKCFIYPIYSPSYILHNEKDQVLQKIFRDNLYNAINDNRKFKAYKVEVEICNENKAFYNLTNLNSLKEETVAIDIETTGLKPHRKGHEIYSIAITQSNLFTFSFLLNDKVKGVLKQILQNPNIKKIIQNCQFEYKWIAWQNTLNVKINNIIWDTQLAVHILDNRKKITGLKFQTYINFGISDYSQNMKKYLEAKEKGGNEFNEIKKAPINELLTYNGYDAYFTMLLYQKQIRLFDDHLLKGFNFFLESNLEIAQYSGIRFDNALYEKYYKELTISINNLDTEIRNSKEVKLLEKEENNFYIGKILITKDNFNYDSSQQLGYLLFNICKLESIKKTKNKQASVDEEALSKFEKRLTDNILARKKLLKIRDTYLEQFKRESVKIENEYYIFPSFDLNRPVSYRSSAYNPSFQNIPRKDEYAKNITRGLLFPRKGNFLLELDGKQMEVGTSCCYHFDPIMINYVANDGDMHRDLAKQIFFKDDKTFTKLERNIAKGNFVFAEFYGDTARLYTEELKKIGYGSVTLGLWEQLNVEIKEHLKSNGIYNIYDFQKHIEEIEKDFWGNRFKVYQQWKYDNWKEYKEKGYVELYTGFRCTKRMTFNEVNNIRIQGTAYHIAQNVLNKVSKFLRKEKFKTVDLGEVHDSGLLDVYPPEFNYLLKVIDEKIKEVQKEWDWIIVPLKFEYAVTGIDESWNLKKELKI